MTTDLPLGDTLLFGASELAGVVAVEGPTAESQPCVEVFRREGETLRRETVPFHPFLMAAASYAIDCPVPHTREALAGQGPLDCRMLFADWPAFQEARSWLQKASGETPGSPSAPYLVIPDATRQFMLQTGVTFFKGMRFEQVRRLQFDIECITTPGYEFCHAGREGDRIVAIGLADQTGWTDVIGGKDMPEKEILAQFVRCIQTRDPDVLEGHNLFHFDLPYIATRAARHGVRVALGRDGSEPSQRSSQVVMGDRTTSYKRFDVYGRQIVDTFFLAQAYDQTHRALDSLGLKAVARHFGVAAEDRTYIAGSDITRVFEEHPEELAAYVTDDVKETRSISDILSRSAFAQSQMLPLQYQDVVVRGNAVKIDLLLLRAYYHSALALPRPSAGRPITGGYTDLFIEGVVRPVHHCDIRSLYPSLMLSLRLGPASDPQGVFLDVLDTLRTYRLETKAAMQKAGSRSERTELDALQSTFKILINSFYGYLGFSQARFNDFEVADRITSEGRNLLADMVVQIENLGGKPIEIDTDGIYYIPPSEAAEGEGQAVFQDQFRATLPTGIEIEFDDAFEAMYSYKMKNYALLRENGEMIVKGAALKSRGLERFQREFLRKMLRLKLEGREKALPSLKQEYDDLLQWRKLPIEALAKTETLSDAPSAYQRKRDQAGGARRAPYELALQAEKAYRAGDQVAYYVTGTKKNVSVHEHAKLVSDWDPANRDENVAYYQAKLDALYKKFGGEEASIPAQGELF